MKKVLMMAACALLVTGVANAGDVALSLVGPVGPQVPGNATLEVKALVTPTAGEGGLALFGFDLDVPAGVPLASNQATTTLTSFVKNEGLTNPAGFGGTLSGATTLLQIGGGQNTIGYTGTSPAYPTGAVVAGVGLTEVTVATIVVDTSALTPGDYVFQISNGFANLIDPASQPSAPPYTVSAATMLAGQPTYTLTITIGDTDPPGLTGSAYSWKDHGTTANGTVLGKLGIEFPEGAPLNNRAKIETRSGSVTELTFTFDEPINPATFIPANIQVCGISSIPGNPATAVLDGAGTAATLTFAASQIPNGYGTSSPGDSYVLVVGAGVTDIAGNPMDATDNKIYFAASFGNVNTSTVANWRNVNPNDRNLIVAAYNDNPTPAQAVLYDVYLVGVTNRGKINPNDSNQVVASYSATLLPDAALPSCP